MSAPERPDGEEPATFAHAWAHSVGSVPAETFLIFEGPDGHVAEWTYADFDRQVGRVAAELGHHGVRAGSCVHLALANSPTFVAVWLAAVRLGAWIVPVDPQSRTPELAEQFARTGPLVGFCADDRAEEYRAAASTGMTMIEVDETDVSFGRFPDTEFADWAEPGPRDRAAVLFTSGTTGRPKGVEVTQANYAFAGRTMAEAAALTPEDRQLVVLPLFHANAQYYSFASAIWAGASVALMSGFSASGFLGQAVRHKATCASLFAAPMRMILARAEPTDGVSLRHCWYAQNITGQQYETLSTWFGCRPRQLYGMTETLPAVLTDDPADPDPSAMGYPTPGCLVDVQHADGTSVPADEVGQLVVGGEPGITLFAGYLDDPDTTAASFRNGWFLTGDQARRDGHGRHFFAGRHSDVLKVGGENVSVIEIEAVLAEHGGVLEAAVIGQSHDVLDEVPVAYVVPADPANPPSSAELDAWCERRLAKVKRPRSITLIDALPRTSVGKIRKYLLKGPGA